MSDFKIRFITENDFVGDAIRFLTFSEFSHVEIILEDGSYLGAHDDGGIQVRPVNYCKPSRERRYAIPVPDALYAKGMAWARAQIGVPYNFKDIAGLALHNTDWNQPKAKICSQFVFETALQMGIYPLNVLPGYSHLVTPETLHLSPLLIGRCCYEFPKV